jgi:hypothetical protein
VKFQFKISEKYPDITIIHHRCSDGTLWATSKRRILKKENEDWIEAGKFPRCYPRDFFGWSRPTARMARADKCNLYVNRFGRVLAIRGGSVFTLKSGRLHFLFNIQGDSVLHRSICEDKQGFICFGEYFMNPARQAVRIWQISPDLSSWKTACELPGVRHVHGIFSDPYDTDTLWATVGDFAGECYLLRTRDGFKTMDRFGDGSQIWRAVNLFFTRDTVNWLTDSNLELNHACRMERADGKLEIGQEIDCSSWYGCTTREGLHLAFTTVEQGPAILSSESSVLISQDAFHWEKIFGFKKDCWRPVKVFKYGVIACPSGETSLDELYLSGEGLVGLDGISIQARITGAETSS